MENKLTILVVDDVLENIEIAKMFLKDQYIVKTASNGKEALIIAKEPLQI